ncbi:MAG: hypothetical protein COA82_01165 [Alkaliphilus sp.]|nr:hypothetical protein [Alkaliphilus sp. AH-315-G20]MBN4074412.1 hypothetical protein [bacterium AH-315-E09]PHS36604.1 MAG: hypothetical protein COA82_01165 [Alkaliphilus sp.]
MPDIISGTVSLFQAITTWLLILIPICAGATLTYFALQKSMCDDQSIIADKNKKMKNVLISAIIGMGSVGIVTLILSFY